MLLIIDITQHDQTTYLYLIDKRNHSTLKYYILANNFLNQMISIVFLIFHDIYRQYTMLENLIDTYNKCFTTSITKHNFLIFFFFGGGGGVGVGGEGARAGV